MTRAKRANDETTSEARKFHVRWALRSSFPGYSTAEEGPVVAPVMSFLVIFDFFIDR
jgi:hypothetical protein